MFKPDKEVLQDVCRGIALENYGFVYLNDDKEEIRARYDSQGGDDGLVGTIKNAVGGKSISVEELQQTLEEIANDELNEFERLRTGVYFYDPANAPGESDVAKTLEQLFKYDIVVSERELKSRFNLAKKDTEFFTGRLEQEDYLKRITTSEHGDYFTIGPQLKDESGDAGVDTRLKKKAKRGLLTHADLESVIDAAATSDVIRYLEKEGFIAKLEDKYLVRSAVDEFGAAMAEQFLDDVVEEFEAVNGVMATAEFRTLVENELAARSDVLSHVGRQSRLREEVLDAVREATKDAAGIELADRDDVAVLSEAFDHRVNERSEAIIRQIEAEYDGVVPSRSVYMEMAEDHLSDLSVGGGVADGYYRSAVEERVGELATAKIRGEPIED
jgi:hypothetical protein